MTFGSWSLHLKACRSCLEVRWIFCCDSWKFEEWLWRQCVFLVIFICWSVKAQEWWVEDVLKVDSCVICCPMKMNSKVEDFESQLAVEEMSKSWSSRGTETSSQETRRTLHEEQRTRDLKVTNQCQAFITVWTMCSKESNAWVLGKYTQKYRVSCVQENKKQGVYLLWVEVGCIVYRTCCLPTSLCNLDTYVLCRD